MLIVRISGNYGSLLLTSVRLPGGPALEVNVQRLDPEANHVASVGLHLLAHIQNFGDVHFDEGWAGFPGQKLRIEAFAIVSAGPLGPESVEYRGVTADGLETAWLSHQMLCGSRGKGVGLTGYAVRLRPDVAGLYDCTYSGRFVSGRVVGPLSNGDLCTSDMPGDPLEEIELRIVERQSD